MSRQAPAHSITATLDHDRDLVTTDEIARLPAAMTRRPSKVGQLPVAPRLDLAREALGLAASEIAGDASIVNRRAIERWENEGGEIYDASQNRTWVAPTEDGAQDSEDTKRVIETVIASDDGGDRATRCEGVSV